MQRTVFLLAGFSSEPGDRVHLQSPFYVGAVTDFRRYSSFPIICVTFDPSASMT